MEGAGNEWKRRHRRGSQQVRERATGERRERKRFLGSQVEKVNKEHGIILNSHAKCY